MKKLLKAGSVFFAVIAAITVLHVTVLSPMQADASSVRRGSSDREIIRQIQTKLKNWGYYTGSVDGIFGSQTDAAVRYFQRKNGLSVDGIVGAKTAAAMGLKLKSTSSGSSGSSGSGAYTSNEVYLLAKCIYAEARGEPYIGMVAVGAVILNRVKHPSFPNTVSGVIYQPYAFTAVYDGQMNLEPNATAKRAANDAMNGWDPSYGSIYYYNPVTATSQWIYSRRTVVTIGKHVFAV